MKLSTLAAAGLGVFSSLALAHPDIAKGLLKDIRARADEFDSDELIGDLATKGARTRTGRIIRDLLINGADPESDDRYRSPLPPKDSKNCKKDTCCIWRHVADEMAAAFRGDDGRCNNLARASIRMGFHDAGTWEKGRAFGGADGSIILNDQELTKAENMGLAEAAAAMRAWYAKYKPHGVGAADLIQMAANVATVVCPLGPRVRSFVGRIDSSRENDVSLLPGVHAPAQDLVDLFVNKTIKPHGLAALIGAHTTSQQRFVDPARALDPQDSTPGVWDVKFYSETIGPAPERVFVFPSDKVLSEHPAIKDEFAEFAGSGGQEHWNEDYAKEYIRLSLLGVNNINDLTECTKVLPPAVRRFDTHMNDGRMKAWLKGGLDWIGDRLFEGDWI